MAVRKIKGSWWVDFQIRLKRHRYRSPESTREGALSYEAVLRRELAQHGTLDRILKEETKAKSPTLKEFAERWLQEYVDVNNRPAERRAKRHMLQGHLLPTFGAYKLHEIDAASIERFKAERIQKGLSPKTINNVLTVLNKCLAVAVEWGELEGPTPRCKFLKTTLPPIKYLKPQEANALLRALGSGLWYIMAYTALQTGLRFSELIALTWRDIDLSRRQLCVNKSCVEGNVGPPKNGRIRYVPLTDAVCQELGTLPRQGELVFHREGERIIYETAYSVIERTCKQAGIDRASWHMFRRTFASNLVMRGASLQAVKDLLGHATMNVTLRYAHLAPDMLRQTVDLLEPQKSPILEEMSAVRQPLPFLIQYASLSNR